MLDHMQATLVLKVVDEVTKAAETWEREITIDTLPEVGTLFIVNPLPAAPTVDGVREPDDDQLAIIVLAPVPEFALSGMMTPNQRATRLAAVGWTKTASA